MPLFVFGMSIAESSAAFRAVNGRRIIARLIVGRNCLTHALHVLGLLLFHRCTSTVILTVLIQPLETGKRLTG